MSLYNDYSYSELINLLQNNNKPFQLLDYDITRNHINVYFSERKYELAQLYNDILNKIFILDNSFKNDILILVQNDYYKLTNTIMNIYKKQIDELIDIWKLEMISHYIGDIVKAELLFKVININNISFAIAESKIQQLVKVFDNNLTDMEKLKEIIQNV